MSTDPAPSDQLDPGPVEPPTIPQAAIDAAVDAVHQPVLIQGNWITDLVTTALAAAWPYLVPGWESPAALQRAYSEILAERDEIIRILDAVRRADLCEDLSWNIHTGQAKFFLQCSDLFWWGTADFEPLTTDSLPAFERAAADLRATGVRCAEVWASELYAARQRGMRPQGAAYPIEPDLWPLFDACGPERETELGNPHPHPSKTPGRKDARLRPVDIPAETIAVLTAERDDARKRLELARQSLIEDGYFDPDQVGNDIAPRITEWLAHHRHKMRSLRAKLAKARAEIKILSGTDSLADVQADAHQSRCAALTAALAELRADIDLHGLDGNAYAERVTELRQAIVRAELAEHERDGVRDELTRLAAETTDLRGTIALRDVELARLSTVVSTAAVATGWAPWMEAAATAFPDAVRPSSPADQGESAP